MQLDRIVAGARTRLVQGGFGALLRASRAAAEGAAGPGTGARRSRPMGSGSWANAWPHEGSAMERAMAMALPRQSPPDATPPEPVPDVTKPRHGRVRTKPLMSLHEVRLHNWLLDRLEAEAPTCSLHARVAFGAFLATDPVEGAPDPLEGLVADMLIADRTGQPVVVLLRASADRVALRPGLLDALREADLPVVDLPPRPGLADLWDRVARTLPTD